MALLIIVITVNLKDNLFKVLAIILFLFFIFYDLSGLSSSCDEVIISAFLFVLSSLVRPSLSFFFSLVFDFFGLGFWLALVGLILAPTLKRHIGFLSLLKLITGVGTYL